MPIKRYNGTSWDVVAGDGAVGATGASGTASLTTKGDIQTFDTAANRLPVGSDGQTLVANSSQTTGLAYTNNFAAGKNAIINGDFRINQRNFTSNTTSGTFNFDRWVQINGGTTGTMTVTPQVFTAGAAPVAGYEFANYVQCVTAAGASADTYALYQTSIEDVRTLAGQTATLSFWAKAATGTPKIALEIGQAFGVGGSPSATVLTAISSVTTSTSWTRYTITFTVPSISGKTVGTTANTSGLYIYLWLSAGTTLASRASSIGLQNATFQFSGIQLEAGSVATAFQTATGTVQGELAACQRYYIRLQNASLAPTFGQGSAASTASAYVPIVIPVTLRVNPSSIEFSALQLGDGITFPAVTTCTLGSSNSQSVVNVVASPATSVLTQYRPYTLGGSSSSGYLGFNAEL